MAIEPSRGGTPAAQQPKRWRTWLALAIQRQPGRLFAMALGVGAVGAGVIFRNEPAVAVPSIPTGLFLAGAAALLPWIKLLKVGNNELQTRDPNELAAMEAEVEELRKLGDEVELENVDLPGDDEWDGALFAVGEEALDRILTEMPPLLADCEARVFLYDSTVDLLVPARRPADAPHRAWLGWRPDQGANGDAFTNNARAVRTGDSTHDSADGLTPDMQAAYADLTAVAAIPLTNRAGDPIGVLSLSSTDPRTQLAGYDAYWLHLNLATKVSVILVELLYLGER